MAYINKIFCRQCNYPTEHLNGRCLPCAAVKHRRHKRIAQHAAKNDTIYKFYNFCKKQSHNLYVFFMELMEQRCRRIGIQNPELFKDDEQPRFKNFQ